MSVTTLEGDILTPTKQKNFRFSRSDPALAETMKELEMAEEELTAGSTPRKRQASTSSFLPSSLPVSRSISSEPKMADSSMLQLSMSDVLVKMDMSTQTEESASPPFRPLLIFIPLRLGQEKFNMEYTNALKECFSLPQSVGVIGGRPRHALWIMGYNGGCG